MRLRSFLNIYEAVLLAEASKYDGMFSAIVNLTGTQNNVAPVINWARQTLQREDRIIWFLRWYRLLYLRIVLSWGNAQSPDYQKLVGLSQKYANEMSKQIGQPVDPNDPIKMGGDALRTLQGTLSHFLSLPIQGIQNLQFSNQLPHELFRQMTALEDQWKEETARDSQFLQTQEGDEVLIPFDDGWAWWKLTRGACSDEANAMGHCGNVPSERPGDTILSLRKQSPRGWRPSLTFILHEDGMLGEMKGRNNDKPQSQYHPYIITLLQHDMIKGIVGGGYAPERNFAMTDLPEEQRDQLMEVKPALATAAYIFKKFGPTDEFGAKAAGELHEQTGQDIEWNSEARNFIVAKFDNVDDLLATHGTDFAKRVGQVFSGGDDMFMDADYHVDKDQAKDLLWDMPEDIKARVLNYALRTYGSNEEYEDYDWTSLTEVWDVMVEQEDQIVYDLERAVETGLRYGAESECHDSFVYAMTHAFEGARNSDWLEVNYTMYQDIKGENHIQFDGFVTITISPKDAIRLLDDPDEIGSIAYNGFIQDEINVEEPHYGWSGYDESAAQEEAMDLLSHL